MLNINILELKQLVDSRTTDPTTSKQLLAIALGVCIARKSAMPKEEVNGVTSYYNDQVLIEHREGVYKFNESIVIDADLAMQTARSFWLVRYNSIYPDFSISLMTTTDYDFFCRATSVDLWFSPDQYKFANENKESLVLLVNAINKVLS